jgi:hypothetical protein
MMRRVDLNQITGGFSCQSKELRVYSAVEGAIECCYSCKYEDKRIRDLNQVSFQGKAELEG